MTKEKATSPEKKAALEAIRAEFKGTSANEQAERMLAALRCFPVTTFEAMRYLDVYCPPARVQQLREQGYEIKTLWQVIETESGDKHRVGLYVLEAQP